MGVKENRDNHHSSHSEAFSEDTKRDDNKATKNIDHEGFKRKVKENHDNPPIKYRRSITDINKNDDITNKNNKIIIKKNPLKLQPWRRKSQELENTSIIKEETFTKKETELKLEIIPNIKNEEEKIIKKDIKKKKDDQSTETENPPIKQKKKRIKKKRL